MNKKEVFLYINIYIKKVGFLDYHIELKEIYVKYQVNLIDFNLNLISTNELNLNLLKSLDVIYL